MKEKQIKTNFNNGLYRNKKSLFTHKKSPLVADILV